MPEGILSAFTGKHRTNYCVKIYMTKQVENVFYAMLLTGAVFAGQNAAVGDVSGNLVAVVPGDPIFNGVDVSAVTYFHHPLFADPALDIGATLLGDDGAGVPLIARNANDNVLALNFFPAGGGFGGNNAEFYELLHNSVTSLSASPDSLLIIHSDAGPPPTAKNELSAFGALTTIDEFDTRTLFTTPTLAELNNYDVVLAYSNATPFDPVALGDVLADYVDAGGGLVLANFTWTQGFGIEGRIVTTGYSPFTGGDVTPVPDSDSVLMLLGISLSLLYAWGRRRQFAERT